MLACRGDTRVCHHVTPPLSIIEPGGDRIGHEAARGLAELVNGVAPTPRSPMSNRWQSLQGNPLTCGRWTTRLWPQRSG